MEALRTETLSPSRMRFLYGLCIPSHLLYMEQPTSLYELHIIMGHRKSNQHENRKFRVEKHQNIMPQRKPRLLRRRYSFLEETLKGNKLIHVM